MTAPATAQTPPPVEPTDSGPGFFVSMGILILALGAIRLALPHVDPRWQGWALGGVLATFLMFGYLRTALFKGAILTLLLSATFVCVKARALPEFSATGLRHFGTETVRLTTGWGAGKQLAQIVAWKRKSHARIIEGAAKARTTKAPWKVPLELYEPYVAATNGRDATIRAKAIELTRGCPDDDEICEVAQINRFVSTQITYRKDPRGRTDFVQNATTTLEAGAGDCEDQTILMASLLEAIGKRTLLAFSPGHAYPVVCFDKEFQRRARQSTARAQSDASYRNALFDAGGWPMSDRPVQTFVVDGRTCFPLEPTNGRAYIGYPHEKAQIEALVDPVERQYVRFSAERTTGLHGT